MTSNVPHFIFISLIAFWTYNVQKKKNRYFLMYSILGLCFLFFVFCFFYVVNVPINGSGRKNIKHVSSRNVLCAGL